VTLDYYDIVSEYGGSSTSNDMADFDETITISLNAENVGVDDAHNVSGLVSIDDSYISLDNNIVEFGDIAAGGYTNAGNIMFTIGHNVPDGHIASFTILFFI